MPLGPEFTTHALKRARERYYNMARKSDKSLRKLLTAVILFSVESGSDPNGNVFLWGHYQGGPIKLVVDPATGCVVTIINPLEALL